MIYGFQNPHSETFSVIDTATGKAWHVGNPPNWSYIGRYTHESCHSAQFWIAACEEYGTIMFELDDVLLDEGL